MITVVKVIILVLLLPLCPSSQEEDDWPSLGYLRNDYKSVPVVAHVLIREAEITGRIGGYENWKISCQVLESFKGRFHRRDVVEYFHGAEAGLKKDYFTGEKIVFLLADYEQKKKAFRYSALENSTLSPTKDRLRKLRMLRRSFAKRRS